MLESILAIIGISILVIFFILFFFLFMPWRFGAPFQPSSKKETKNIIKLANVKKGDKVAELGSGNGKLVIEFAKLGAEVHGYEVNPFLVCWSRRKIKKTGLEKRAFIHKKNFWNADLKDFDVIIVFQIYYVMEKLARKIKKQAKKNARVVSNTWRLPKIKPVRKISHVYLYKVR